VRGQGEGAMIVRNCSSKEENGMRLTLLRTGVGLEPQYRQ